MAEMTIKRFGVISVAKMYGLLTFIVGLIIGVIYGLFIMIFGVAMSALPPGATTEGVMVSGIGSVVIGVIVIIGFPIAYGLMGFISGAIGALIYNAVAGMVGGVKFELEGVHNEYAPPPPPNQWAPNQYPAQ